MDWILPMAEPQQDTESDLGLEHSRPGKKGQDKTDMARSIGKTLANKEPINVSRVRWKTHVEGLCNTEV